MGIGTIIFEADMLLVVEAGEFEVIDVDEAEDADTQCSKIGKKCNFKSTKKHYLHFQKWQKINFCTRKKFKTTKNAILNFFLVQKLIFCHF